VHTAHVTSPYNHYEARHAPFPSSRHVMKLGLDISAFQRHEKKAKLLPNVAYITPQGPYRKILEHP